MTYQLNRPDIATIIDYCNDLRQVKSWKYSNLARIMI